MKPDIELSRTTDAAVWAREWVRIATKIDSERGILSGDAEGWMLGWFANAIETGRSAGRAERDA